MVRGPCPSGGWRGGEWSTLPGLILFVSTSLRPCPQRLQQQQLVSRAARGWIVRVYYIYSGHHHSRRVAPPFLPRLRRARVLTRLPACRIKTKHRVCVLYIALHHNARTSFVIQSNFKSSYLFYFVNILLTNECDVTRDPMYMTLYTGCDMN